MKFKLPSLQTLWLGFLRVAIRFPLEVVVSLACTVVWCLVIQKTHNLSIHNELVRFILIGNLALTLLLSADLYAEANLITGLRKWVLRASMVLICVGFFYWLKPVLYQADNYRIALLAFSFHLLVAFAPFIGRANVNGFWEFNKTLFLRFLSSALYSAVLYLGLAAALAAIDSLFNVKIDWVIYMRLFAIVVAGFSTIFFLAGVPETDSISTQEVNYPKGLKVFTQYVLIPLMTIYLVILLVYEVKIMVNWEFPKGMVSLLILGYAVFGILSLLLVYPIRDNEGNGWIRLFSRFFYFMMIPLVVLLLLAVWTRVSNYGVTEPRYILICLAVWLTAITLYFLLSKAQNIKVIPMSLCLLALIMVYGPQSVSSVSKNSQISRLKRLMKGKNNNEDRAAVIRYLVKEHGLTAVQQFTTVDLGSIEEKIQKQSAVEGSYFSRYTLVDTALSILKVESKQAPAEYLSFYHKSLAIDIKSYDYIVPLDFTTDAEFTLEGVKYKANRTSFKSTINLYKEGKSIGVFDMEPSIKSLIASFRQGLLEQNSGSYRSSYFPDGLKLPVVYHGEYEFRIHFRTLSGTISGGSMNDAYFQGYLLVKIK